MKENKNLRTVILVLIGFIAGYGINAALTPASTPEVLDDEVAIVENDSEKDVDVPKTEIQEVTSAKEDEVSKEVVVQDHTAIPNNISINGYTASVNDQSSGNIVYISQVEIPDTTWIAIREDNDGVLGNILGARRYPAGDTSAVVELIRGTTPGEVYYVVFYQDDGDGEFDHKSDTIAVNTSNDIISTKFRTF